MAKKKLTPTEQYVRKLLRKVAGCCNEHRAHDVAKAVECACGPPGAHLYYNGDRITMSEVEKVLQRWVDFGEPKELV